MKIIITGGAGFIGCNAANRYVSQGHEVIILDDLSRKGAEWNLNWLLLKEPALRFFECDIRDEKRVESLFAQHADASLVVHLAGQVAVTTSIANPRDDFEANAIGSFNILEAARKAGMGCPILYASTNKVYGGLGDLEVREEPERYRFASKPCGVCEEQPLDFHSPYGCSKGAADQYFRDYHRIYGLRTVVLRQSCIYGYRQFGVEDQGWVAWFMIAAELGRPITIYGDGKQVRDVLFIDDLLDAYDAAVARIEIAAGQVYNIGGGPSNAMSLLQLLAFLRERYPDLEYTHAGWRPGDQRIYVSDIRRAAEDLAWTPRTEFRAGLDKLQGWVAEKKDLFR